MIIIPPGQAFCMESPQFLLRPTTAILMRYGGVFRPISIEVVSYLLFFDRVTSPFIHEPGMTFKADLFDLGYTCGSIRFEQ
jgi:hypothetical protein